MRGPLAPLARVDRSVLLRRAASATVVTLLAQVATGWALRLPSAPLGIVSLELAGSGEQAAAVLATWDSAGLRGLATVNVLLDFSFLLSYTVLLAALAVWAGGRLANRGSRRWLGVGSVVGWGQVLAGALDAVENVVLLLLLSAGISDGLAGLVRVVALARFGLVALGLAWAGVGLIWGRRPREI